MLRLWVLAMVCLFRPLAAAEMPPLDSALQQLYNFNFAATHDSLTRYIAANPRDPMPFALRASAYLFSELDRLGILESEFLVDDAKIAEKKKVQEPDANIRKLFLQALTDTQARGDEALKANPNDRNALLALCIAQGVATDYMAFVDKRQFSSLSLAKRSNNYAQRLLKLDPKYYDAYLSTGISEYMVGSLPFFVKWFVHFDNVSGNKDRGKENLALVANEGHYFRPFAKILLGIISLREKRPQDAQKVLIELTRDYPGNPLFRKELAKLNSRLGVMGN
jgi:hypothetical protein